MRRRAFLASAAAGLAGLAGCLGGTGNDTPETESGDPGATATPPPSPTPTPGPGLTTVPPGTDPSAPADVDPSTDPEPSTDRETAPGPGSVPTATGEPTAPSSVDAAWPLPAADAGHTNATAAAGPADPVAELWRVTAGSDLTRPVLADGTLFVGGADGVVRAYDARDGRERWRRSVGDAAGVPRAVGDRVYVPTPAGLVALAAGDGREDWRVDALERADVRDPNGRFVRAALLVTDGGVYSVANPGDPSVVARSLADGSEQWRTPVADPWDLPLFSGDGELYLSSGPHDSRFWRFDAASGDRIGKKPRYGHDFPAERCYANGTVYAVEPFFGSVDATAVTDAGASWSTGVPPGGGVGGLAAGRERVYYTANVEGEPSVTALGTADGSVAWTRDLGATVTARPVVASEALLVPTDAGLWALDPADGRDLWLVPDAGSAGDVLVSDDLVFGAVGDSLRAFRPP